MRQHPKSSGILMLSDVAVTAFIHDVTKGVAVGALLSGISATAAIHSASHFWDITRINAVDRVVLKVRRHDIPVGIVGLNEASLPLVDKLGTHNKEGAKLASGP